MQELIKMKYPGGPSNFQNVYRRPNKLFNEP